MRRRGFTAVEAVLVIVVLAIIVGLTMWQVNERRQAREALLRSASANNLTKIYTYALGSSSHNVSWTGHQGYEGRIGLPLLPPYSTTPGQLTPGSTASFIQDMLDVPRPQLPDKMAWSPVTAFISPAHPKWALMETVAFAKPISALTDASYWYIAYPLLNEEVGLEFVNAYRKAVEDTGKPPTGNIELTNTIRVYLLPDATHRAGSKGAVSYILQETSSLTPLGERSNWGSLNAPLVSIVVERLPILIERPGLQRGGSNVLFLDGHVEFIEYPGKWPMTEKFIKALESLDELKSEKRPISPQLPGVYGLSRPLAHDGEVHQGAGVAG